MRFLKRFWPGAAAAIVTSRPPKTGVSSDGRLALRKKQRFVDGFIWAESLLLARGCIVKDVSAVGAMVELWQKEPGSKAMRQMPIPDKIVLFLVPDRKEIDCQVTWRRQNALGLKFNGAFRPATRRYGGH